MTGDGLAWIQNTLVHRRVHKHGFETLLCTGTRVIVTGARDCMGSEYRRAQARRVFGFRIHWCTGTRACMGPESFCAQMWRLHGFRILLARAG
eukprot:8524298-Karenia_brevis.AAC.1